MEVYHTSTQMISSPDVYHSRKFLDFGSGFYVTTLKSQAIQYAERFIRRGRPAYLNVYEMTSDLSQWRVLTFPRYNAEWLNFVTHCRRGNIPIDADIVIGGIANDRVFATVDLYFSGYIPRNECLKRLKYEKPNNQICFLSQNALTNCLIFKSCTQL